MHFSFKVECEWIDFFQGLLADVLKCLGDNKKHMRECTLNTLDSWLSAVQLDKMVTFSTLCLGMFSFGVSLSDAMIVFFLQVPYIAAALTDTKLGAEGRKDLFEWLSKQLSGLTDFPDAVHLLKSASSAMTVILN